MARARFLHSTRSTVGSTLISMRHQSPNELTQMPLLSTRCVPPHLPLPFELTRSHRTQISSQIPLLFAQRLRCHLSFSVSRSASPNPSTILASRTASPRSFSGISCHVSCRFLTNPSSGFGNAPVSFPYTCVRPPASSQASILASWFAGSTAPWVGKAWNG